MGAQGSSSADFKEGWKVAANKVLGSDQFTITWVAPSGAAASAGLLVNDRVVAVNAVQFGATQQQHKKFYTETGRIQTSKTALATLSVKRGDETLFLNIQQEKICGYPVVLRESDAVNAFADGKRIMITKGMMRFAQDDQDLALVIAHELGHNVMGHLDKRQTNYWLGNNF